MICSELTKEGGLLVNGRPDGLLSYVGASTYPTSPVDNCLVRARVHVC